MSQGNASAEDRPSVGRTLQKARLDAGLTVEEISATTRVRAPIIQAMEQDDFSRCGGEVYARGHLRALARAVGLSPDDLIARFNTERGTPLALPPAAPVFEAERIRPEPRRPNWTAAMVAAIVAVVGFVGFNALNGDGRPAGTPEAAGEDTDAGAGVEEEPTGEPGGEDSDRSADDAPGGEAAGEDEEAADGAVAGAPADRVTVRVVASGRSWVSVRDVNGQQLFEGELEDGDSETFTDDERIDLITGNAGAIELYVNGRHIPDVGGSGEVQRLSFTKGDPEEG
ncbi:helix-turn-helix domain-containing protein [Streptomyces sp. ST2-7A]|uniref:helix-turn-helix domain-containing protein n=1 Tax=Streptomyces sp. ST2-7A TaxID=2907214 RepID=UPI001F2ACF0D|nr:helix-turn-helix domain-containing protein [Streptomyces sp. ST2-7A]MCE7083411.1 helix-turn-helix domain-containing protein [Streptomyces sp. ST2-7A]